MATEARRHHGRLHPLLYLQRLLWTGAVRTSLGTFLLQAREGLWHCTPYPCVTVLGGAERRPRLPPITLCHYSCARCSHLTPHNMLWLGQHRSGTVVLRTSPP